MGGCASKGGVSTGGNVCYSVYLADVDGDIELLQRIPHGACSEDQPLQQGQPEEYPWLVPSSAKHCETQLLPCGLQARLGGMVWLKSRGAQKRTGYIVPPTTRPRGYHVKLSKKFQVL